MSDANQHLSTSSALNEEVGNLRAIAERLGSSIGRLEEFVSSPCAPDADAADSVPETDRCRDLAQQLHNERNLLIVAWEQLEKEQRKLVEAGQLSAAKETQEIRVANTTLPPVMPSQTPGDRSYSKRIQFQQLQREIDGRR